MGFRTRVSYHKTIREAIQVIDSIMKLVSLSQLKMF